MPGLIEAGKLYKSVPPLYGIKQGKSVKYFASSIEFTKYIQGVFLNKYQFTDIKNRKIPNGQATSIFYRNRNYVRDIEVVSSTYAIDPDLLESVLYELAPYIEIGSSDLVCNMAAKAPKAKKKIEAKKKAAAIKKTTKKTVSSSAKVAVDEDALKSSEDEEIIIPVTENSVMAMENYFIRPEFDFKSMAKNLKKKYRFLKVDKVGDIILLEGLVNSRYQYIFLNKKFINSCIDLINIIKSNDEYYKINGEVVSIYGLMKAFDESSPRITRYKGLGEQNADELKLSAMDPNGYRTLIRYTLESAKDEINSIRETESNMYSLLRELKVDRENIE